ncbi:helix-turn-helix transcriptional regulator [Candidatus Saccharibacteria bacterium]|nr:helix-turn-helix transcriptional regulator [Candidatus Saccharibacteria bacterium]MBQ6510466.1 helix-turn-helix transcriptional regulator [Candidatus Saccharibacteria bacterium]
MEDKAYIHDDEYYYEIIRRNMRKYRNQHNLTQQQLADLTDMSREYICDIENTSRNKHVSIAVLGRIAEVLNMPIGDFFIDD